MQHLAILLCIVLGISNVHAQYTQIPDPAFEQYLIDSAYDSEGVLDGQILTTDAQAITEVMVDGAVYNVADFSGIEEFTSMITFIAIETSCTSIDFGMNSSVEDLNITDNPNLTSINILGCINLRTVDIAFNDLQSLDTSQNSVLTSLSIDGNNISSLDVSMNLSLLSLLCTENPLEALDLSDNVNLIAFNANDTNLSFLDLRNGNNTNIQTYRTLNTPNLFCVFVDDVAYSTTNWTEVDPVTTFVETEAKCDDLGTEEVTLPTITIHPNPAHDFFYVDGLSEVTKVSLTNLRGQTVKVYRRGDTRFSVAGLSKGMYFLSIKSDDRTIQKRIIIH